MKPTIIFSAKSLVLNLGLLLSCNAFSASLQNALNDEITARQKGDAGLQTQINTEAGARQTADTTLQTNIDTEATSRAAAVNKLQAQISSMPKPGYTYTLIVGKDVVDDGTKGRSLGIPEYPTITEALDSIPTDLYSGGLCSAHYLIKVLPGTYTGNVVMKPCVDIEGSGELTTTITAANAGSDCNSSAATVSGANEAELRFLTVVNTGGSACGLAIYNNFASPRLTQVTAIASGGNSNIGVENSYASPTMTNVTVTASGGSNGSFGVHNTNSSSPTMTNVTVTASGGSYGSFGVFNSDASTAIHRSTLSGGKYSVYNVGGTVLVGASQLVGPVSGNATCAASYNGNFTPLSTACQ